ncbi:MAG: hypothetical protein Q9163_000151 [Psora crenata]
MASRQMRRSGLSSPKPFSTPDALSTKQENRSQNGASTGLDVWEEPPLRTPAPSFEDYKGLERHGVLEHMAPLGSLPNSKVKARMKQHEPSRRPAHLKPSEARSTREEMSTPELAPPVATRRSVPRNEERPSGISPLRAQADESDHNSRSSAKVTPAPKSPTEPTPTLTPTSPVSAAQIRWRRIIDSAVKRATDLGNIELGLAIRKLYDESIQNQVLAELLDAVLTQRATEGQAAAFQVYIRAARKQLKKNKGQARLSTASAMSLRSSATRQLETSDSADGFEINHLSSTPSKISSKPPTNYMAAIGSPSKDERPSKRMKRSNSASSDSTLSSLNSDIEDFAPDKVETTLAKTGKNHIPPQKPGVLPGLGPRLGSFTTNRSYEPNRHSLANGSPEARAVARQRLKQIRSFQDYVVNDSSVRSPLSLPPQATPTPTTLQQRNHNPQRNGIAHRERETDEDMLSSPGSSPRDFLLPSTFEAGGATPANLGQPSKGVKKAVRIKQSPLKKRNGVTAGIAQAAEPEPCHTGGGRNDDNASEHAEICSACSGNGTLLLCEDCPRAYHFTCCDPPVDPKKELPDTWRCWHCTNNNPNEDEDVQEPGIWTKLNKAIKYKNPTSFYLPKGLREYFEGVVTGEEGEYEELHNVKLTKTRTGYEEQAENFRLKDRKDNTILCFRCGGSSMGKREIVSCDFCLLHWHLDCLDPPLASAPNKKSTNGKPRQTWMCPNHVDQELAHLKASATPAGKAAIRRLACVQPGENKDSRTFRTRRPKKALVIDIGLRRGFRNNGIIEIAEEDSEEESEIEKEMSGVVYRVPEKGIKLDFIDRIKRLEGASFEEATSLLQRRRLPQPTRTANPEITPAQERQAVLGKRPFKERKAALNLAQIAQADMVLSSDKVINLIDTLTVYATDSSSSDQTLIIRQAEAPAEVEALVAAVEKKEAAPAPVSEQERKDLEILIALARRRLDPEGL